MKITKVYKSTTEAIRILNSCKPLKLYLIILNENDFIAKASVKQGNFLKRISFIAYNIGVGNLVIARLLVKVLD